MCVGVCRVWQKVVHNTYRHMLFPSLTSMTDLLLIFETLSVNTEKISISGRMVDASTYLTGDAFIFLRDI